MNRSEIEKQLDFDIEVALKCFRRIYPEFSPTPVDVTADKKKLVVFVGDGYHAIDERTVSKFYTNLDDAKRD